MAFAPTSAHVASFRLSHPTRAVSAAGVRPPPNDRSIRINIRKALVEQAQALHEPQILSSRRRRKIEEMRAKEELVVARNRLVEIIFQKLSNKYRTVPRKTVHSIIENRVSIDSKLSTSLLSEIEEEVKKLAAPAARTAEERQKAAAMEAAAASAATSSQNSNAQKDDNGSWGRASTYPEYTQKLVRGREWQMLQAYKFIEEADSESRKQEQRRLHEQELKRNLDAQVAARKQAELAEKQLEKKYVDDLMRNLDQAEAEKRARAQMIKEKNDRAHKLYEHDLELTKQRKQREHEELLRQEQELYQKFMRDFEEEQQLERQRKQEEAERQARLIREIEEDKKLREQQRLRDIEEDKRKNREFEEKLDRETREREEAFQRRVENMKKFAEQIDNGPMMRAQREEEERVNAQMLKDQAAHAAAAAKRELDEAAARQQKLLAAQAENKRMIEEKRRKEIEDKLRDDELGKKFRAMGEEQRRANEEAKLRELRAKETYGQKLTEQLQIKKTIREEEDMVEAEKRFNSDTIKVINNDKLVYDRICHRLRLSNANSKK